MTREDKRDRRAWLHAQLTDSAESWEVVETVDRWKAARQARLHLVRAIKMYTACLKGDFSLLEEYFPGVTVGGQRTTARRPINTAPIVTYGTKSESDEVLEALDGLGLDSLDFGR